MLYRTTCVLEHNQLITARKGIDCFVLICTSKVPKQKQKSDQPFNTMKNSFNRFCKIERAILMPLASSSTASTTPHAVMLVYAAVQASLQQAEFTEGATAIQVTVLHLRIARSCLFPKACACRGDTQTCTTIQA